MPAAVSKASVAYVERQLREVAARLCKITGQRLDEDRLREAVRSSNRARESQLELLELLKHCPSPWQGGQLIAYSINGHMFNGTEIKERLNQAFLKRIKKKIATGTLRPEKHRLYWFAWPPTYPSNLFDTLQENEVAVPLYHKVLVIAAVSWPYTR